MSTNLEPRRSLSSVVQADNEPTDCYAPSSVAVSEATVDIILYVALGLTVLAVFSFCLQIILNIHREVVAGRIRATTENSNSTLTTQEYLASRPLSHAELKLFPIKVFIPHAGRALRLREEIYASSGPSAAVSISEAHLEGGVMTCLHKSLVESDVGPEEIPCCGVCLEDYSDFEVLRELPCQHTFHRRCIDPWLTRSSLCPTCRHNSLRRLGKSPEDIPATA